MQLFDMKFNAFFTNIPVETSKAGPGNLEVTVNGGHVPTSAQAQGSHTYAISFTPKEAKPHMIELRFNSEDIPGWFIKIIKTWRRSSVLENYLSIFFCNEIQEVHLNAKLWMPPKLTFMEMGWRKCLWVVELLL